MPTTVASRPGGGDARGQVWLLDDLEVDAGRRVVRRGNETLAVSGLSLDLLLALIESAPNIVTNDELMDRVWCKVVVAPETLTQRVKLLRNALGDDPRQPRYVLGVRGRGYRLVPSPLPGVPTLPVTGEPAASSGIAVGKDPTTAGADNDARSGPSWRPSWVWLAAGALAVAVATAAFNLFSAGPEPGPADAPTAVPNAVAVMPFSNVDGSEAGATLAGGMAEALLHRLMGLKGVAVISRYSSFALSGSGLSASQVGTRLGARYLLEGSVQGDAHELRVRTALTDVTDGRQLWSMQFDRGPEDLLAVQDEIAAKVAEALTGTAALPEARSLAGTGTSSAAAQLAYLQGAALADRMITAEIDEALQRFDEALRVDSEFASANAGAAAALLTREELRDEQRLGRRPEVVEEASRRAALALQADPRNGEGLIARARVEARRGNIGAAEQDFLEGIAARPNNAEGHLQFARFLFYTLDPFEHPRNASAASAFEHRYAMALRHCDTAALLDPLSPAAHFVRGQMALHLGRRDEARKNLIEALDLDPNFPPALGRLSQILWLRGEVADAILYGERALAVDPEAEWIRRLVSQYYVELGEVQAAESVLIDGGPGLADGRLAVLLREQRWEEAGALALADPMRQPRSWDRDFATFALLEWARRSPEASEEVLKLLRRRIGWKSIGDQRVVHHGSRFAALAVADMLMSTGREDEGRQLTSGVIRAIEADRAVRDDPDLVAPMRPDGRTLALALVLSGKDDAALASLEGLVRDGELRHLWYDMDLQPAFDQLRRETRFTALHDEYRARIRGEREKLEILRGQGAVPGR